MAEPIVDLEVVSYSQINYVWPFSDIAPGPNWRHNFRFNENYNATIQSSPYDLNDGAAGKYIFGHNKRYNPYNWDPIKEIGVLSGGSSSIVPPSGWVKINKDLNEGAGGDYIYLCYKR